jgi:hypothetical protein
MTNLEIHCSSVLRSRMSLVSEGLVKISSTSKVPYVDSDHGDVFAVPYE